MSASYRPETLALHAGYTPDPTTGARAVPIYHTTSYVFEDSAHAARLFALEQPGNIYTRIMNPTTAVLEARLAALEGGVGGLAVASGQAAEALALTTLLREGDTLVAGTGLYGGTYNLFRHTLPRFGITTRFVDPDDLGAVEAALAQGARALYVESLPNPSLRVPDLGRLAALAHGAGVPLVVDNTVATAALLRPIDHGADLVVQSCTKYVGGHGTGIGGAIVDAGRFDWSNGNFPEFTEPDPSYHGLRLHEAVGPLAFLVKARVQGLRDLGPALSPLNAHGFIQGLETLHLRMARHSDNALALARWLADHPRVDWVRYPGLPGDPGHASAVRHLRGGFGGLLTFGVRGGLAAGRAVVDRLQLFSHVANIGDVRSLVIHPASTTHQQLTPAQQAQAGVTPELLRLSVGLEHVEDLQADLDQALDGGPR